MVGRRKIPMKKIEKDANRQMTFCKRRKGLFKKASTLCELTGCKVAAIVFSPAKKPKPFTFGDMSLIESVCGGASSINSNIAASASHGVSCGESSDLGLKNIVGGGSELKNGGEGSADFMMLGGESRGGSGDPLLADGEWLEMIPFEYGADSGTFSTGSEVGMMGRCTQSSNPYYGSESSYLSGHGSINLAGGGGSASLNLVGFVAVGSSSVGEDGGLKLSGGEELGMLDSAESLSLGGGLESSNLDGSVVVGTYSGMGMLDRAQTRDLGNGGLCEDQNNMELYQLVLMKQRFEAERKSLLESLIAAGDTADMISELP